MLKGTFLKVLLVALLLKWFHLFYNWASAGRNKIGQVSIKEQCTTQILSYKSTVKVELIEICIVNISAPKLCFPEGVNLMGRQFFLLLATQKIENNNNKTTFNMTIRNILS